jgi:L-asparagine transporter-like permease
MGLLTYWPPQQTINIVDEKIQELLILMLVVGAALAAFMLYRPQRKSTRLNLRQTLQDGKSHPSDVREVNVIFQYNGHDFDAYEVLGVPAGSRTDAIRTAYENSIASMDAEARDLLDMAFNAIMKKNG